MAKLSERQAIDRKTIKKAYHKPVLTQYDDLRTITLGSSPGGTESSSQGQIDFYNA